MVLVSDGKGNMPIEIEVKTGVISITNGIKRQGIILVVIDSNQGFLNREITRGSLRLAVENATAGTNWIPGVCWRLLGI